MKNMSDIYVVKTFTLMDDTGVIYPSELEPYYGITYKDIEDYMVRNPFDGCDCDMKNVAVRHFSSTMGPITLPYERLEYYRKMFFTLLDTGDSDVSDPEVY